MAVVTNSSIELTDRIKGREKEIESMEVTIGKGLMMPSNASNSGPRKILAETQASHLQCLKNPEVAALSTGYETQFGINSSTFIQSECDYRVLAKILKFSFSPDHYFLIVQNLESGIIDSIEVIPYEHITESYGYGLDNSEIDKFEIGTVIPKGTTIKKSATFDKYNNKMNGRNLMSVYIASETTKEDAIEISDFGAEALTAPLYSKAEFMINENDIPLNMYGNESVYKPFPNIGEETRNGILMGIRREKNNEAIYAQTKQALITLTVSDLKRSINGKVVDIDIRVNNRDVISKSTYFQQFEYYFREQERFCREVVNVLTQYILSPSFECGYEAKKLYMKCNAIINGLPYEDCDGPAKYFKDKPFSNIMIEFTVQEENIANIGDKVANRYGGKGVIGKITPRELMPKVIVGGEEKPVDIVWNVSTCINRENFGQANELSINNVNQYVVAALKEDVYSIDEKIELIMTFYKYVSPSYWAELMPTVSSLDDSNKSMFIDSIVELGYMTVSQLPMTENFTIDKIEAMYDALPFGLGYSKMKVPQEDSMGNTRWIEARRKIIGAPEYVYRLKQYSEEKFSAVSLSSTNLRGENSRSNSKKNHTSIHSKNPVKFFGEMESHDIAHAGVVNAVLGLMIYSSSPHARQLASELLTGDPYDVNIKVDSKATNRSAEQLNCYLQTIGLRFKFLKRPKNLKAVMTRNIMEFIPIGPREIMLPLNPNDKLDVLNTTTDAKRLIMEKLVMGKY